MSVTVAFCLIFLMMLVSGSAKSLSDTIHHHWSTSIFAKFGSQSYWGIDSWVIKYRFTGFLRTLFSTVLVAFTDAWHTGNLIRKLAYFSAWGFSLRCFSALSVDQILILLGVAMAIDSGAFHVFYTYVFQKKQPKTET